MKSIFVAAVALIVLSAAFTNASAGRLYVGAGIGNTFFSDSVEDATGEFQEIDENSTAWKIFGGVQAPKFIGVEFGYRDFGNISSSISSETFESKTAGWDLEAMGRVQIAMVDVFAKVGAMFWTTDVTLLGLTYDESGTDLLWGLGAGVHLGAFGLRLEWESVETDEPDGMSMVSLGGTFGF